ncbi:Crp/Fnr family transcriptional regulator [Mycobacterium sp. E2462]|uniref:Crp/Fnr family transcriptional regulator n=1 Tax=Mycobacterium sp. E2462 TaxID=1834133 RepID=UPI0007FCE83D|nr:Crp/Fnr family transcriptional regulator [Mycobacterium sp. E2462]OBI07593.1 Crp/Fnr family transcriptional regulator [Mycobacterium sp. E2462]
MSTPPGSAHADADDPPGTAEFACGQTLFTQGEPGDRVYLIVEGKVKISLGGSNGRTNVRAILGPSDIVGELAVFDPGPRSCTATAITDVRALWLDRAALRGLMARQPAIAEQLLQALTQRVRETEEQLVELVSSDVAARVARQLLALSRRFGAPEGDALRVTYELSQEELAQLVGADRASVNKALRSFTARGWIQLQGKSLVVTDAEALARRSGTGDRTGPDPNRRRRPLRASA